MARRLATEEGVLVGISSGAAGERGATEEGVLVGISSGAAGES